MKLFKWKHSKSPSKEADSELNKNPEKKHKKSFFRRFYTTVFLKSEVHQIIKQNTQDCPLNQEETNDLILFYLLQMNKLNLFHTQPQNLHQINENKFITSIMKELNNENIDLKELSLLCIEGIPFKCKIIRPICWKLLLNYLPSKKNEWKETLELKKILYENYVDLSFSSMNRSNKNSFSTSPNPNIQKDILFLSCNKNEHPLSVEKTSNWNHFFSDQKLWDEIEKDVNRTRNNHLFFSEINFNNEFFLYPNLSQKTKENTNNFETHYITINRLLYVFAKQNPELKYVQGMNEIIAALYYCFSHDENSFFKRNCETDTYFCFEKIMQEIKENFICGNDKKLDEIEKRTKQFSEFLKKTDLKLWYHLKKNNIGPEFYFNKWMISMLTQEFQLDDILSIWDSVISSKNMLEYVIYLSTAILFCMRDQLICSDFSKIMELLQNTSKLDIKSILIYSNNIFKEFEIEK